MKIAEDLFDNFPVIETERCILRQVRKEDGDTLYEILSDRDVMQYFGLALMHDRTGIEKLIENRLKAFELKRALGWIVADKTTNNMIGLVNFPFWLRDFFISRLSYILHKDYWGKGLMSEVLPYCLKFGFNKMAIHRIEAVVYPQNKASIRLIEKLRFRRECLMEEQSYDFINGRFNDAYLYCLLEKYWDEE